MLNFFRNTPDPILLENAPREEEVSTLDAKPAELLAVLYGRLHTRLQAASQAVLNKDESAPQRYLEVRRLVSQLHACLDPSVSTTTIRHMRALLAHIAERLALSDDRKSALEECEKLIAPVSDALMELSECYAAAAMNSQTARVLHS